MGYWGFAPYVSVAQKKARAEKKLQQLKKKMPDIRPVILSGKTLARSWWAKSWNTNLERYADYDNRIDRGKSYLRHGAVLDLKIRPGKVEAMVLGSAATPYTVVVDIRPIGKSQWQEIKKQCEGHLQSLQELLAGRFSETLGSVFFDEKKGLFPDPKAIKFQCSCPDWASMCKHVAAVLYGIGARFDEDPSLFFTLRGVDMSELVAETVSDRARELLRKTEEKSAKVIDDADLSALFGIDMESKPDFSGKAEKPAKRKKVPTKSVQRKKSLKNRTTTSRSSLTATDRVAAIITAAAKGITITELAEQTGYEKTKLYGLVHKLKKEGVIHSVSYGVYGQA